MSELSYEQLEHIAIYTPRSEYVAKQITNKCKTMVSDKLSLPEFILDTYLLTEGAPAGHIRENSDDTYDIGPMQINSINWPIFYQEFGVTPLEIRFDGCINLAAGAYLIRKQLDRYSKKSMDSWEIFFKVAANYHSKTPEVNQRYKEKWIQNFHIVLKRKLNDK